LGPTTDEEPDKPKLSAENAKRRRELLGSLCSKNQVRNLQIDQDPRIKDLGTVMRT